METTGYADSSVEWLRDVIVYERLVCAEHDRLENTGPEWTDGLTETEHQLKHFFNPLTPTVAIWVQL